MDIFWLQLYLVWHDCWNVIQQHVLHLFGFFFFFFWLVGFFLIRPVCIDVGYCTTYHGVHQNVNAVFFFLSKFQVLDCPSLQVCYCCSRRRYWNELTPVSACSAVQLYPVVCDPIDYRPPGSSVRGILQARILESLAVSSSRGSSRPRDRTCVYYIFALQANSLPLSHWVAHWKEWCWFFNPLATRWKDPDAGKDWRQEEKGVTEDEMVGWHHRLNGHEFEQTPGDGEVAIGWLSGWHNPPLEAGVNWPCHLLLWEALSEGE